MKVACHSEIWPALASLDVFQKLDDLHVYSDFDAQKLLRYDIILDGHWDNLQQFLLQDNYRGHTLVWFLQHSEIAPKMSKQIVLCTDAEEVAVVMKHFQHFKTV